MTIQIRLKDVYKPRTVRVGYCDIQYLTRYMRKLGYYANAYGWRFDLYDVGEGFYLSTGYGPTGDLRLPYDVIKRFNDYAQALQRIVIPYAAIKAGMLALIEELRKEIIREWEAQNEY